ncbi:AAA family ATPase [Curtobacterium ammoniigenes]|uniref:AAA family ATPase n=1 Tax=Curtobacterium ammoniigenes TaxID=395387 RepID=UPI00082C3CC6|nr:SMC family ATPase [Curtobacterium ammoniigenes]
MYLHTLDLRAIGPFPGTVHIDFAALGASGVFLLDGPTGAGKSTIIDAIAFALYGSLAGESSSVDRLHSQHADPGVEPFVDLVFETAAGVHRVRRTPAYARPKRGGGTVRQHQSAQLWRLAAPDDQVGEPISDRAQEIGVEIPRIIGLDRAQFVQTVILPQGEFARFLRSSGEDRRRLLQSLFATDIYEATTEVLVQRRRDAAGAVQTADAAVTDALSRFQQASGVADADIDTVPRVVDELAAAAANTARHLAAERDRLAEGRRVEHAAEQRLAAVHRRAELLARSATLDNAAADVASSRARLLAAERASRVLGVIGGLEAARERFSSRERDHDRALEAAAAALQRASFVQVSAAPGRRGDDVGSDDAVFAAGLPDDVELLEDRIRALRTAVAEAATVIGRAAVFTDRRLQRTRTATALQTERESLAALDARIAARPAERAALIEAIGEASIGAAELDDLRREHEILEAERTAHETLAATERELAALAIDVSSATSAAQAAVHHEAELRERRIAGLAGELGAELVAGTACPVCGSIEHPNLARPADDHPTPDDIDRAAAARADAEMSLRDVVGTHAACRERRDALHEQLAARPRDVLDTMARDLERRRAQALDAAQRLRDAQFALDVFDAESAELTDRRSVSASAIAAAVERLQSLDAAIDEDRSLQASAAETLHALGADPEAELDAARDVLAADAEALQQLVQSAAQLRSARTDLDERGVEVARALDTEDFLDAAAARQSALDPPAASALRATVAAHEREATIVAAGLAEPAIDAAAHDAIDDAELKIVRANANDLEQLVATLAAQAATAAERSTQSAACAIALADAVQARDAIAVRTRAVVRLADLVSGQPGVNPSGITLGTFVLMRRFADVIAAANARLVTLFGGRFALEPSDERERGSKARRTGLALAVRDHHTDRTRDPRSLSGGETFTVSLCLALGLADVVQAEAGGTRLGTLFVDEGFGTLDPETLDDVLGQLAQLTADGRQVGIVSHVEELKQRIPERISVRRSATGGSTVTTTV